VVTFGDQMRHSTYLPFRQTALVGGNTPVYTGFVAESDQLQPAAKALLQPPGNRRGWTGIKLSMTAA
jgi:hypothetical protein